MDKILFGELEREKISWPTWEKVGINVLSMDGWNRWMTLWMQKTLQT
jgi:hypothetical protein